MKSFLPETLAGLPRTNLSAERNTAMGIQVSEAEADYSDGAGRNLQLEITDTGGAQGFIALAAWANVEEEREWDGGYERSYNADGRMVHERWDAKNSHGEYGVIVGKRFSIQVSGNAASMDELKAALATGVNVAALEAAAARPGEASGLRKKKAGTRPAFAARNPMRWIISAGRSVTSRTYSVPRYLRISSRGLEHLCLLVLVGGRPVRGGDRVELVFVALVEVERSCRSSDTACRTARHSRSRRAAA